MFPFQAIDITKSGLYKRVIMLLILNKTHADCAEWNSIAPHAQKLHVVRLILPLYT